MRKVHRNKQAACTMVNEVFTVAMLVVMAIGVFSGFPVALVLAGTGFLGFVAAVWVGITDFQHLGLIYLRARGVLTNESVQFTSVPMLIFLGLILNASGCQRRSKTRPKGGAKVGHFGVGREGRIERWRPVDRAPQIAGG